MKRGPEQGPRRGRALIVSLVSLIAGYLVSFIPPDLVGEVYSLLP